MGKSSEDIDGKAEKLHNDKDRAIKDEDFEKAAGIQDEIDQIGKSSEDIDGKAEKLHNDKDRAIKDEDFEKAAGIQGEIGQIGNDSVQKQIQFELDRRNFARATQLAKNANLAKDKIYELQTLTLQQFAHEYNNIPGLYKLIHCCNLTKPEVENMLGKDYVNQFLKSI